MDGKEVTFDVAYNIEDSNYIQLRSVAQMLSGTKSQFDVYWDGELKQAVIVTGAVYTGVKPAKAVDLTNNPTAVQVSNSIAKVSGVSDIEIVTENHDPNGNLGKQGGYTGCLYFRSPLIPQSDLYVADTEDINSSIDCGTDGGGCIEIYATTKDAERRNEYLSNFDGGALSSGSHIILGTLLIRTSSKLTASQQKALEIALTDALTSGEYDASSPTPTFSPSPMPTATTTQNSSYKIGDKLSIGDTDITVTNVFTISNVGNGNAIASGGEVFYGINILVLTKNQPDTGRYWYANDFIRNIVASDGVVYEMPFSVGDNNKIYPNQEGNVTVYIPIAIGDTIASIVVSDGQGNTVSVLAQ
jgi:hypothetical protein